VHIQSTFLKITTSNKVTSFKILYSDIALNKKVDPRLATRAFMGEEKPDEELMGKRKSSPRLSPTPLGAGTISVALDEENIRFCGKNLTVEP
jgi:hypothetical protein